MKRWLEPSVQSKPSYEEAGLVRYGVLENMAPLGSLPKPKKGTNELGTGARKVILKPPPPTKDEEEEAEFKPPNAKRQATSSAKEAASRSQKLQSEEKEEEEGTGDEGSGKGSRRRNPRRVSAAPVQPPQDEAPRMERESSPVITKLATPQRGRRASIDGKNFTSKVIDVAVDEALKHYRYPTAWALKTLHDNHMGDREFETMVTDVFNQTADVDTLDEFNRRVEEKKREGKRDNQGCYYFVPPSTNSRFTPHKPKPAPYSRLLVTTDNDDGSDECEMPVAKKIKTSHMDDTSEQVVVVANGIKVEQQEGENVLSTTPSRKRARRNSDSSDSSLSSAQSLSSPEVRLGSVSPSLRKVRKAKGATSGAPSQDGSKSQPITSRDKSTEHVASNTTHLNSPLSPPPHSTSSSAHGSMPGRLAASELFPNLKSGSEPPSLDEARASPVHHEDDDTVWKRRKTAQNVTNNYVAAESSVRGSKARGASATTPVKKTRRTRQSLAAPTSTRSTRSAAKKSGDDADVPASPTNLSVTGDDKSAPGSRAVTPSASRQGKKGKGGLRVKSS